MKREIRDRWTAALRSGEYEQGAGRFEDEGRYCCLGVLCDVMGQPLRDEDETDNEPFVESVLPYRASYELAARNDGPGFPTALYDVVWTFSEIADWIDANIPVEP